MASTSSASVHLKFLESAICEGVSWQIMHFVSGAFGKKRRVYDFDARASSTISRIRSMWARRSGQAMSVTTHWAWVMPQPQ